MPKKNISQNVIVIYSTNNKLTSSTTHCFEVCKSLIEIYITFWLSQAAQWVKTDYGLSAGQYAVLPEGKGEVSSINLS